MCYSDNEYGIDLEAQSSSCTIIGNVCVDNRLAEITDAGTNNLPNGATGTTNLALDDLNIVA